MFIEPFSANSVPLTNYLFNAVKEKNLNRLNHLLVNRRLNPNARNERGEPLLVFAAKNGFAEGMRLILAQPGANPNIKNAAKEAALHVTVRRGDLIGTQILVEKGASKNVRDNYYESPLHIAVGSRFHQIVNYLVNDPDRKHSHFARTNINAINNNKQSPLLKACINSDLQLIKLLFQAGARLDFRIRGGFTAKSLTVFKGLDDVLDVQIPMDSYTNEFIQQKTLAHCCGIGDKSKIDNFVFSLTGAYGVYMHQLFRRHLEQFFQTFAETISLDHQKMIIQAFSSSCAHQPLNQIALRIQSGELSIFQAGWYGHALDLIFFKDYLAICNRGEGVPEGLHTVEVCQIDPTKVTKELLQEINNQRVKTRESASAYFYFELAYKLAKFPEIGICQDPLCLTISKFGPKPIKIGICSMASAKAAFRTSMMLLLLSESDVSEYDQIAQRCLKGAKKASLLGRVAALNEYLDDHLLHSGDEEKKPLNKELVHKAYARIVRHVKKQHGNHRRYFDLSLRQLKKRLVF